MSKSPATNSPVPATISPENYSHSPVHYAVVLSDHTTLTKLCSSLPRLADPTQINTESDSLTQEKIADQISAVLDRRDNPSRETPLHLAVRLNDVYSAKTLAVAGADISLQNAAGWNALQEAIMRRCTDVISVLVQHHHISAWLKWRRRLPRLVAVLRRMRDFYMEISFHFESSIVPFVGKIAPSDTYKIWKRDGNLRADTSLAGYDGLKIQRANQSFLFIGDGNPNFDIPAGSLLVLNHDERKIYDAFENAGKTLTDSDIASFCNQTSVYRPGMDVTKSELISRTNWRGIEKTESIGQWKAKVYEMHNVVFSFRSRKITGAESGSSEQVLPLDLEFEEDESGFLVAENPRFSVSAAANGGDHQQQQRQRRHSSFVASEREFVTVNRKSVDIIPEPRRRTAAVIHEPRRRTAAVAPNTKEKEYVKSLKPSVWLTEQFPLKTEELLPLLDILANKVKAVRRMRELLTTKFPQGTFPVKLAIPVVPTVRVIITFTKFIELQPIEKFYTPFSSPRQLLDGISEDESSSSNYHSFPPSSSSSSSSSSWLSRSNSRSSSSNKQNCSNSNGEQKQQQEETDPFVIPSGYNWSSFDDQKNRKMKKSKSTRRPPTK